MLSRLSFIAFFARRTMPPLLARALRYVPPAMLMALIVPMVVTPPMAGIGAINPRIPAAIVAGIVAWFTRSSLKTMVAGMAALWLLQAARALRWTLTSLFSTRTAPMRFEGTDTYIATPDLMLAVNAAITLERPLLVKGEPGTGKTMLAEEVARALGRPLLQWHIKSTTKAQQGLYEYDAVSRLRDSQLGDEHVSDIAHYIKRGVLWEAFEARSAGASC